MSQMLGSVRALLRDFIQTDWRDAYLRSDDLELFLSRRYGVNPMQQAEEVPTETASPDRHGMNAPHLGIFHALAEKGAVVRKGDIIANLDVLGRETEIIAETSGKVALIEATGSLLEYDDVMLELTAEQ